MVFQKKTAKKAVKKTETSTTTAPKESKAYHTFIESGGSGKANLDEMLKAICDKIVL